MTHIITQTSDYGTFKTGAYKIGDKYYRTTGIRTVQGWSWTLVLDNSNHPNLSSLKAHLLSLVS